MGYVFPPWSNAAVRAAMVAIPVLGIALACAPMVVVRTAWWRGQHENVDQPVEFDHRHHVQDDGIDCLFCHTTADRSAFAGVPPTETCMGCHDQIWSRSPMLEVVRRSYFSGAPIPWNRVHRVPDFVYFNHAVHVNNGIGCVSCHGRVDEMASVTQVAPLTMGWCLSCHRAPEEHLRPQSEITSMTWDPGPDRARLGVQLAAELGTRRLTNCSSCHR